MSQGNLACMIGLANTNKIPMIGGYVQSATPPPGWNADGPYIGVNGSVYHASNVLGEDYTVSGGITVVGTSGAAAGKLARWVSNTAQLTISADQTIAVSAGGVATAGTGAAYKTALPNAIAIPANSFFWVFTV